MSIRSLTSLVSFVSLTQSVSCGNTGTHEAVPMIDAAKPSPSTARSAETPRSEAEERPILAHLKKAPHADTQADLDPGNDRVVAPPDPIPDCQAKLTALGLEFSISEIPFRDPKDGSGRCGAHDAVVVKKTKSGISLRPPALVTCKLALAIADLDSLVVELAKTHLDAKVKSIEQAGTYSCRKMKRFDLVSEHSYGNAIDVRSFTLTSGKKLSVLADFGVLEKPPATKEARFLRALSEQAYDRDLVSVSLGPYWDALHKDHFHFDLAHYRVDGSRP